MNSRQRTKLVFESKMPDRPPLGFFAIDSDTAAKVLGRPTFWRAKAKCQIAFWQGRRDEVVQSWIADAIELHQKLDIIDIIPVCTHMASLCPPRGYVPDPPRQIDDTTWEDAKGRIYKYSPVTEDITIVHDPTIWSDEYLSSIAVNKADTDESIFEAVDTIINAFRGERFVLGPCGPVDAWLLIGSHERGLMEMAINPQKIKEMYHERVQHAISQDSVFVRNGQDGVMCGTDLSSTMGPMISPNMYSDLFLESYKTRIHALKSRGQVFIKHACGNNWPLLDIFVEMGVECYQAIQASAGMDIVEVHKKYSDKFVVWDGVSVENLVSGTMDDVRKEVRRVMQELTPKGRFIFGTSHSVAVGTKYDNFMAMLDEFNKCCQL